MHSYKFVNQEDDFTSKKILPQSRLEQNSKVTEGLWALLVNMKTYLIKFRGRSLTCSTPCEVEAKLIRLRDHWYQQNRSYPRI